MRRLLILTAFLLVPALAWAYSTGPPSGRAGDPPGNNDCTGCHAGTVNSGDGTLAIAAPTSYVPGDTYTVQVTLEDAGQMRWGFQLVVKDGDNLVAGSLASTSANTQLNSDYINHTSTGTYAGTSGPASWSFDWTAPATSMGDLTFYAAGNAANNDGGTGGDEIYTSSAGVSGPPMNDPPMAFDLLQPADGSMVEITEQAAFVWRDAVDPDGDDVSYTLQITETGDFADATDYAAGADTTLLIEPGTFSAEVSYDWRVLASDGQGGETSSAQSWSFIGEELDDVADAPAVPASWALSLPAPNPFNPATTVRVTVPARSDLVATIHDRLGRHVATLHRGTAAPGELALHWQPVRHAAGIYFLHVRGGESFRATRKLVLVK